MRGNSGLLTLYLVFAEAHVVTPDVSVLSLLSELSSSSTASSAGASGGDVLGCWAWRSD